jgi:hypothetical protein
VSAYNDSVSPYVGDALYSTDGGSIWSSGIFPSGVSNLSSVSCASVSHCVLVGGYLDGSADVGDALYSTDAGSTWSSGTLPGGVSYLYSVSCSSTSDCVAVGSANNGLVARALYSTDGGATWSSGTLPSGSTNLDAVSCASESNCVALGEYLYDEILGDDVFYSTDGGATWSSGTLRATGVDSVSCASVSHCVAVGGNCFKGSYSCIYLGEVFYSTDGGSTWSSGTLPDTFPNAVGYFDSVSCASTSDCVAVGYGGNGSPPALYSTDGGSSWSWGTLPNGVGVDAVSCASVSDCVAVGTSTAVYSYDGGVSWSSGTLPREVSQLNAVSCAWASDCFAVGMGNDSTNGALVLSSVPVLPVQRIYGADAIGTSIAVSQAEFPTLGSAKAVVLARSDFFSDALAGGPLAAKVGGPLLITPGAPLSSSLDSRVQTEIQRVLPAGGTVYILGGDLALSPSIDTALQGLGYVTERIAGSDEYATAVDVAQQLGNPSLVFEATGLDFPDALSAVPAAIETGGAVLLTDGSTQAPETAAYLEAHPGDTRYAIGGPLAAYGADRTATPVYGSDLYGTSAAVASAFFAGAASFGAATGADFPDALSGGVFVGTRDPAGPMLLVPPSGPLPASIVSYLSDAASTLTEGYLFGGPLAVGDDVLSELEFTG